MGVLRPRRLAVSDAPFPLIAALCAKTDKKARTRSVVGNFGISLLVLMYWYFGAFRAAERAMLDERWTAAALSVGLLPFFVGLPVVVVATGAAVLASRFDPSERLRDPSQCQQWV